jgi:radical SAM/Cys-rich protein
MTRFSALPEVKNLTKDRLRVLQINTGNHCTQRCRHCHVSAGPEGQHRITREVLEELLALLGEHSRIEVVDITGGSPELSDHMPWFLESLVPHARKVLFRSNLSALQGPAADTLLPHLLQLRAEVIASLPALTAQAVDAQRGAGTFATSVQVLQRLNAAGFGTGQAPLALVVNPCGAELPAAQATVEARYRAHLWREHRIAFDRLYTLTNFPLGRFRAELRSAGTLAAYMDLLRGHHNPRALERVMCREMVTVSHDGRLYDCDFNCAAGLPPPRPARQTISELRRHGVRGAPVAVADHCFACTVATGFS